MRSAARTIQQLQRHRGVHVLPPVLAVGGHWDLPVGPLAGQVDADAGHDGGAVLQAEGGEVEAATGADGNSVELQHGRARRRDRSGRRAEPVPPRSPSWQSHPSTPDTEGTEAHLPVGGHKVRRLSQVLARWNNKDTGVSPGAAASGARGSRALTSHQLGALHHVSVRVVDGDFESCGYKRQRSDQPQQGPPRQDNHEREPEPCSGEAA